MNNTRRQLIAVARTSLERRDKIQHAATAGGLKHGFARFIVDRKFKFRPIGSHSESIKITMHFADNDQRFDVKRMLVAIIVDSTCSVRQPNMDTSCHALPNVIEQIEEA